MDLTEILNAQLLAVYGLAPIVDAEFRRRHEPFVLERLRVLCPNPQRKYGEDEADYHHVLEGVALNRRAICEEFFSHHLPNARRSFNPRECRNDNVQPWLSIVVRNFCMELRRVNTPPGSHARARENRAQNQQTAVSNWWQQQPIPTQTLTEQYDPELHNDQQFATEGTYLPDRLTELYRAISTLSPLQQSLVMFCGQMIEGRGNTGLGSMNHGDVGNLLGLSNGHVSVEMTNIRTLLLNALTVQDTYEGELA